MPRPTSPSPDSMCDGLLPELVIEGLKLFNAGEYFEAHEALETAWRNELGSVRELYRGILQAGVAYYHVLGGNYNGALKLIERCRSWLEPFGDSCRGINLANLRADLRAVEAELHRLGPEGITHFNRHLLRPVEFQENYGKINGDSS